MTRARDQLRCGCQFTASTSMSVRKSASAVEAGRRVKGDIAYSIARLGPASGDQRDKAPGGICSVGQERAHSTTWLSRPGARCRDHSRSVSPGRSPDAALVLLVPSWRVRVQVLSAPPIPSLTRANACARSCTTSTTPRPPVRVRRQSAGPGRGGGGLRPALSPTFVYLPSRSSAASGPDPPQDPDSQLRVDTATDAASSPAAAPHSRRTPVVCDRCAAGRNGVVAAAGRATAPATPQNSTGRLRSGGGSPYQLCSSRRRPMWTASASSARWSVGCWPVGWAVGYPSSGCRESRHRMGLALET